MNNKTTWILSDLFYPEETSTSHILTKIANKKALTSNVHVICGSPIYFISGNNTKFSINEKIEITRIQGFTGNKNNLFFRFYRFICLSKQMIRILSSEITQDDSVLVVTNPAFLVLFIAKLKRKIDFKLTVLVHDVFPENLFSVKIFKYLKGPIKLLIKIFNKAYSKADSIIVLGSDMKEVFERKFLKTKQKPNIYVIPNWADLDLISVKKRNDNYNNKIVFLFAGNLGRVQGLDTLLLIISELKNENLMFIFQGSGAILSKLQEIVTNKKLSNVIFRPPYSRDQQNDVFASCDIGLVSLIDDMYGLGVPSKTYNILAASKPILYIGHPESEIALLIKNTSTGFTFSFNDRNKIIDFFDSLTLDHKKEFYDLGRKARTIVSKEYSEEVILTRICEII